jgi:hypothetical protein
MTERVAPIGQVRVWHLALLVLYVAIAIVNIQDQRRTAPPLIALASAGFVLYGLLGWLGWRAARHHLGGLGELGRLAAYLSAMAGLFLLATVVYLAAEFAWLNGLI